MSVIFQSLQDLGQLLTTEHSDLHGTPGTRSAGRALNWGLMRPVLLGLVLVLVLGGGTVYAVQYINRRVLPAVSEAQAGGPMSVDTGQDALQPSVQRSAATMPMGPPGAAVAATQVAPAPSIHTQFYPPAKPETTAAPSSDATQSPDFSHAATTGQAKQEPKISAAAVNVPSQENRIDDKKRVSKPPIQPPPDRAQLEIIERQRRAVLEKSARIGRLVHRIERAMAGADASHRVDDLLDELGRIKGPEHPYVQKLRACWLFKQGRYEAAAVEFGKVLSSNPHDPEAGVNLALIEIHSQKYEQALARLKRLRSDNPDNTMIADLIKRLQ